MNLENFRLHLQPALDARLQNFQKRVEGLTTNESIRSYARHVTSLAMNGKRVRPYLCSLGYRGLSDWPDDLIMPVLTGLEFFHLFALVHDDIMDQSPLRHGVLSAHAFVKGELDLRSAQGDHSRSAQGQAILLGDLLLTLAHECFQELEERHNLHPEFVTKAKRIFIEMSHEVAVGQMLDLDLVGNLSATQEQIIEKHRLKTAWYTIVRPLQIGVALAEGSAEDLTWCEQFGEPLGIGFQLTDDILDCVTPTEQLGKPRLRDIREGQPTLLTQHVMSQASEQDQAAFASYFGRDFILDEEPAVLELLERTQAINAGKQMAEAYFVQAEGKMSYCPFSEDEKKECAEFAENIAHRTV